MKTIKLVVNVSSTLEHAKGGSAVSTEFLFYERKAIWVAADDSIRVSDDVMIGVHAEIGVETGMLHLTFIHGSIVLADFMCQVSRLQRMMFRFSDTYSVFATVENERIKN